MNNSLAVFLINDTCRAVMASYETGKDAKSEMFKTFDQTVKVGDFVMIPTTIRHQMTVFCVTEVDVEVDFESSREVRWIVGKVDTAAYTLTLEQEQEVLTKIKLADMKKRRAQLRTDLIAGAEDILISSPLAAISVDAPAKTE